jgi:hypothetical protein
MTIIWYAVVHDELCNVVLEYGERQNKTVMDDNTRRTERRLNNREKIGHVRIWTAIWMMMIAAMREMLRDIISA